MSEYPQHDIAREREDDLHALTAFVDWLTEQGIHFATWGKPYETSARCEPCLGTGVKLTRRDRQVYRLLTDTEAEAFLNARPVHSECHGSGRIYTQKSNPDKLALHGEPFDRLFARFVGIDHQAFLDEKDQMYDALVAHQTREAG